MISRREVVTAGVLCALAGSTADLSAEARVERAKVEPGQDDAGIIRALNQIEQELERLNGVVDSTSRVTTGSYLGEIRARFTTHLRSSGKFPEFMEIGIEPFYEVYDWHVRHQQQIQITRIFRAALCDSVDVYSADHALRAGSQVPWHPVRSGLGLGCVRVRGVPRGWCRCRAARCRGAPGLLRSCWYP